jgi:zinc ribbon protein
MLCAMCGVENPDHASFCRKCGTGLAPGAVLGVPHAVLTEAPPSFYYSASAAKVYVLGVLTFGVYSVWWFWSQCRAERPNEGRMWTLFRTLLSGYFFYPLARDVEDEAFRKEVKCWCPPAILMVVLWVAALTVRLGSEVWRLGAVWVLPVPLTVVQVAINRINAVVTQQKPAKWRWWEITIAVLCGLFWILILIGLLLRFISPTATDNA